MKIDTYTAVSMGVINDRRAVIGTLLVDFKELQCWCLGVFAGHDIPVQEAITQNNKYIVHNMITP